MPDMLVSVPPGTSLLVSAFPVIIEFAQCTAVCSCWSLTMEEEDFSILQKSVIPNLLQDDFNGHNEQTFLTELHDDDHDQNRSELHDEDEIYEDDELHEDNYLDEEDGLKEDEKLHQEDELRTEMVLEQKDKQKCFQKDIDFRQTLIDEDSFKIIESEEKNTSQSFTNSIAILDIVACFGLVVVILDYLF